MATMDKSIDRASVTVMRSQAAERNKSALLDVIKQLVPNEDLFALEIASGTGQHVTYFADSLSNITWQPSECDDNSLRSIRGYIQTVPQAKIRDPLYIDTTHQVNQWGDGSLAPASCDLMMAVNLIHISHWQVTEGLFRGAGYYLKPGAILATYGPYKLHGEISPESNVQFDRMLKQQCCDWGLRDVDELEKLAAEHGLSLEKMIDMPANNKTLIFRKQTS